MMHLRQTDSNGGLMRCRRQILLRWLAFLGLLVIANTAWPADKSLPAKVDLSADFEKLSLPPRAQGSRDVCSLFAITGLVNFEYAHSQPASHTQLSEEFLIWAAQKSTGKTSDQAMFYEAVCGLNRLGICADRLMPYANKVDAHRKPSAQALADARKLSERWNVVWIKRWNLTNPLTDQQLHEIREALANQHPVACGMRWPKHEKGHQLLKVLPANEVEDGHSILVTGYVEDPQQNGGGKFLFRNSWGPGWGDHGYGEMSYAYARAYTNDSLWMHFGSERSEVPTWHYEAESLPVIARQHCETNSQKMKDFRGAMWSGGAQLFCGANHGGFVELGFDVGKPGRYRVRVLATAAPDFGIVRIGLPGAAHSQDFDLYSGRVSPSGSLELGSLDFNAARYVLRFTSIDKNHSSADYRFGIDAIDLIAEK
jgi:hypothetical protein